MSERIKKIPNWTTEIEVPRDGETIDAADVKLPLSDLLGNDMYLDRQLQELRLTVETLRRQLGNLTVNVGGSIETLDNRTVSVRVGIGRTENITDPVTMSVLNLPPNTVATWSQNPVPAGEDFTTLTLQIGSGVAAGGYDVDVKGETSEKTAVDVLRVKVLDVSPVSDITLRSGGIARAFSPNAPLLLTFDMELRAISGPVTTTVINLPAGVIVDPDYAAPVITGDGSDYQQVRGYVGLKITDAAAPGTYVLQMRASNGSITRGTTETLQVQSRPQALEDFSVSVAYDEGSPFAVNGGWLNINRAGGFTGPVEVFVDARFIAGLSVTRVLLDGGDRVITTGNRIRLTATAIFGTPGVAAPPVTSNPWDEEPTSWDGWTYFRGTALALIGGQTVTRTFTVSVRTLDVRTIFNYGA